MSSTADLASKAEAGAKAAAGDLAAKVEAVKLDTNGTNGAAGAAADSGDEEDDAVGATPASGDAATAAKKKKKSGAAKKKKQAANGKKSVKQTDPPTVGLTKIFSDGIFPVGEIQEYDDKFYNDNRKRITAEEQRERDRIAQQEEGADFNYARRAAEVHRTVRGYARKAIKPGMTMTEIAELIENGTRTIGEANGLESGIGFPTGLSLNEVAAHYTPNAGDKRVLQESDVLKVDFGVHVKGRIVDSAFTLTFGDSPWNPLLDAVRSATNAGIREAGVDARLSDIGKVIQETMESYEFEAEGKTQKVKVVKNLNGHNIDRYKIHGGKSVPCIPMPEMKDRMEEGEYFAIETFGSTGKGYVENTGDCSHYARKNVGRHVPLRVASARSLLHTIDKNFGTLPFCRRYLDRLGEKSYLLGLKHLVQMGVVEDYPPLADIPGSKTAQFEHTFRVGYGYKEVLSRGDDY
ncbi:peptidase methionine aminopeptidase [Ceraceosorus bombacis]|uniref:Methionine aminopeptidase 2 n=1 Tax=Ceraceosorus bombacis TaxID=401625 RepID=A0A0P1BHV5_9BASI|nr:peptidase methionine aminopeptidase [Ceraceosorus bombacis]